MTKIALMSDIHGKGGWVPVPQWEANRWGKVPQGDGSVQVPPIYPEADILIIAGDILSNYAGRMRSIDAVRQLDEIVHLNAFLANLKKKGVYKEIVVVAGNHDWAFQLENKKAVALMKDVVYLQDSAATVLGLKFYGSPWTRWFFDWAFNFPDHNANFFRARAHARNCWDLIPSDTQILVTHGPPEGILDQCIGGERVGDTWLKERLPALPHLKLHAFGHIHWSNGYVKKGRTHFVNAAICAENYRPENAIRVIEI
jgi:Icc-related predicted phosphoesterase